MKIKELHTQIEVYHSLEELSEVPQSLMQQAQAIRLKAYAPYSQFLVGAAVLLSNGAIVVGNNQENASYPSGLCAERTAIYAAAANYPEQTIWKMAIAAGPATKESTQPVPPCGACRQSIAEYEQKQNQPIEVYFMGTSGNVYCVKSLLSLLPLAFDKHFL